MDLGSIFLILALLVLVGLFVSRPLFERQGQLPGALLTPQDQERSALMAERDRLLNALHELDFDYSLGKIPEGDYPGQRALLLQRGADVLRKLDGLQADPLEDDVEARIEAAIAARRAETRPAMGSDGEGVKAGSAVSASVASPDDELEVLLANRRRERQEKAVGFCPQCGGPVQRSDRFCPKCGVEIT